MQQQMGQGASLPSTAVMQSPYGPISLVPVLTNTGAVVYAPTSALPGQFSFSATYTSPANANIDEHITTTVITT